jgi:hypothetical protein
MIVCYGVHVNDKGHIVYKPVSRQSTSGPSGPMHGNSSSSNRKLSTFSTVRAGYYYSLPDMSHVAQPARVTAIGAFWF